MADYGEGWSVGSGVTIVWGSPFTHPANTCKTNDVAPRPIPAIDSGSIPEYTSPGYIQPH